MSTTVNVDVDPAADAAFEKFLDDITQSNTAFARAAVTLRRDVLREVLRTTFYLGWAGGEQNAISKITHE